MKDDSWYQREKEHHITFPNIAFEDGSDAWCSCGNPWPCRLAPNSIPEHAPGVAAPPPALGDWKPTVTERFRSPNAVIDILSVWAVRYALGRATYAVHDVVESLITNADALSVQSKAVIVADIDKAKAERDGGPIGMQMDDDAWMRLREKLA